MATKTEISLIAHIFEKGLTFVLSLIFIGTVFNVTAPHHLKQEPLSTTFDDLF